MSPQSFGCFVSLSCGQEVKTQLPVGWLRKWVMMGFFDVKRVLKPKA